MSLHQVGGRCPSTTSWDKPLPSAQTTILSTGSIPCRTQTLQCYLAKKLFSFEVVHRPGIEMIVTDFLPCFPEQGGGGDM